MGMLNRFHVHVMMWEHQAFGRSLVKEGIPCG